MAKAQLHGKTPSEEKKNPAGKTQKPLEQGLQADTPSLQNAVNTLHQPTPSGIHVLQRTVGNRAVQSLVEKKQNGTNGSTVIQRHVGLAAEPAAASTDILLDASADSHRQGLGAVMSAQAMFQSYRAMAAAEPVPQPGESRTDSGGEGHGYEFDNDPLEGMR